MVNYLIVQAGGKGTRMKEFVVNKPKALLDVNGKPLLFTIFDAFTNTNKIVIGSYKFDILKNYVDTFSNEHVIFIKNDIVGTTSGIKEALFNIPNDVPLAIIWSDLYIIDSKLFLNEITSLPNDNYVFLTNKFECRWSYNNVTNKIENVLSQKSGIIGFFIFKNKKEIEDIMLDGNEFVSILSKSNLNFKFKYINSIMEIGTREKYHNVLHNNINRSFNTIEINNDMVYKSPNNEYGLNLFNHELEWYKYAISKNFKNIPFLDYVNTSDKKELILKYVDYKHRLSITKDDLKMVMQTLNSFHNIDEPHTSNFDDIYAEYYIKTFDRVSKVRNLIPFINEDAVIINNDKCKNIYELAPKIDNIIRNKLNTDYFYPIHGDCTFSNILINKKNDVYLIDPRGYFGKSIIYGDRLYDYSKLYYSYFTGYDIFNSKLFSILINDTTKSIIFDLNLKYDIVTRDMIFFNALHEILPLENINELKFKIKFITSLIWLSLTSYVWNDYDMILGSYYYGILQLNDILKGDNDEK